MNSNTSRANARVTLLVLEKVADAALGRKEEQEGEEEEIRSPFNHYWIRHYLENYCFLENIYFTSDLFLR